MRKTNPSPEEARKKLAAQMQIMAETIVDWNQCLHGRVGAEKWEDTLISTEEMLYDILDYFLACSGTSPEWHRPEFMELGDIVFVHSYNALLDTDIQLGMDRSGFFLKTNIPHPGHLPRMPDDFWQDWLKLADLGNFRFEQSEVFAPEVEQQHPALFEAQTDNLFTLMRNLICYEAIYGKTIDLGSLRLEWPFEQWSVLEVIDKGAMAMTQICRLNQRLSVK